ncbi:hypothetical protein [Paenibacillus sp. FSL H7-0331]|uniref:hypothetical protein n=1 Tax=Paenibacillus sp. FSL H7-0331 TaxID=1920421 RepID=UPI0009700B79|nr:hypothetical protein [Paenibacillus sp. FSL H7-0331]OME97314.1 hypothetical protein BK127_41000 [Paenibacillus sp. FSL H7-0331]
MKIFILWMSLFLLNIIFLNIQNEYNRAERHFIQLKYIAEEAAAAATQYYQSIPYSNGTMVFDQTEGIKAAEYVIRQDLNLDNNYIPMPGSYWVDKVTYNIQFFDDSNTTYPILYNHSSGFFSKAIGDPTVVVTINVGKPRYSIVAPTNNYFRTAAHEWKER